MADQKPSSHYYSNLGGINQKSSEYSLEKSQFLDLRNVDFNVPNALQKRPGSTQAVSVGTSGPVTSLFEYVRLQGPSFIIAGSDTAMFYLASNAFTLLDTGWTNGQPTDMLTFVNKLWMANGQKYSFWGGSGSPMPVGMPCQSTGLTLFVGYTLGTKAAGMGVNMLVGGYESNSNFDGVATLPISGVWYAYSYVRDDGYHGPADFLSNAKQIVIGDVFSGLEWFYDPLAFNGKFGGFTIPSGYGISAINLWIAVDRGMLPASSDPQTGPGERYQGITSTAHNLGYVYNFGSSALPKFYFGITLRPDADLSKFWLYTTFPGSSLVLGGYSSALVPSGVTLFVVNRNIGLNSTTSPVFLDFFGTPPSAKAFSGVPFCWFNTNTPKYIDVNQNVMFMSGFSNSPSTLWYSEIGQPENIQPESQFEVRTNDGDRVIGHKAYNNQVIVLKDNSFHKIVGDSPENFELIELSLEYGCLSNKTIVEFREKIAWLDSQGVVIFDGASWDLASYPVEDIFRRMNLTAAKEKAVAVNHLFRNQLWFGIPIDGSTENNVTVIYDYLVDGWTFFDGFNPSSFALMRGALSSPTVWRGSYSGMIYYHGESFYGDNGVGISCGVFSNFDKWDGENSTSIWRRFFLDVQPAPGLTGSIDGAIDVTVYSNYDRSTAQASFTIYQSAFQSRAEIGVVGKAMASRINHFSASLPLLINGYTWTKRFLRNV